MTDDPQQLVDDALSPVTTSSMASLPPTPAPLTSPSVAMGDETPLAFVAQPSGVDPIPLAQQPPLPEPAYIPPAQDMPSTPKTKHGSKILMMVLGIFALLGVLGAGGYYAYTQFGGEKATVAEVKGKTQDSCNGCQNGGWLVWRDGKCRVTGICGNTNNPDKNTQNPNGDPIADAKDKSSCSKATGTWCESNDSNGKHYAFCVPSNVNKGCNTYAVEKGYTITYGASWSNDQTGKFQYKCSCSDGVHYFDKPGICNSGGVTTKNGQPTSDFDVSKATDPNYYNKWGLCGIVTNPQPGGGTVDRLDYNSCFSCSGSECHITSKAGVCSTCKVVKYTCEKQVTGNSCVQNGTAPADSAAGAGKSACGKIEQIDVLCDGHYIQSRTIQNGACTQASSNPSPSPSASTAPKLVCNSLTKNVADTALKLNSAITFTCNAAVTPAGAATPTYQFRYMIGTGAWQTLAASGKTASLTPTQCGVQYQVQCRACATLGGVKQCDPVWQGVPVP